MENQKTLEEQIARNRAHKANLKFHPSKKAARHLDTEYKKLLQQLFDRDHPGAAELRAEKWNELVAKHKIKIVDESKGLVVRAEDLSKHFEDLYDKVKGNQLNATSREYRLFKRVALKEIKELQAEAAELKKFFNQAQKPLYKYK